jgi:hypothetical protein
VNGATLPTITANDAIVVNSVPSAISSPSGTNLTYKAAIIVDDGKAKRSSHGSHSRPKGHSDIDFGHITETHSITVIEVYADFDWTDWKKSICLINSGDRDSYDEEFGCTRWGGFDGKGALEAEAHPCLQQRFADKMISYAKKHGGRRRKSWIKQVLKYRRHPRKVVKTLGLYPSTPYCLEEPHNSELYGVWNSQVKGVDFGIYGGPNYDLKAFGDG